MEKQNDDLFRLTAKNVEQIRYIRLNKKASYQEEGLDNVVYNKIGSEAECESIQFYSFGFYDSLMCIKPRMNTSMDYKNHFLISYPFEKKANTLKVEQWFGILPLSERKCYFSGVQQGVKEPFFCEKNLQAELPFVGAVLVSLSYVSLQEVKADFKQKLVEYIERISIVFNELKGEYRYIAEVYYSLNCADLCVVIRTDALPFIHRINRGLYKEACYNKYAINTTVIFAVQDNVKKEILKKYIKKNSAVSFVVRSNEKYKNKSKGVNGTGRYVTTFGYEEYVEFLLELCRYKLGGRRADDEIGQYVASICHEREWFDEEGEQVSAVLSEPKNEMQKAICQWIKEIYGKVKEIEEQVDNIFYDSRDMYKYQGKFAQEYRLIKDLIYSYSDLWYQNASESGFIFFAQIMVALQGIHSMLEEIEKINCKEDAFDTSAEDLFKVMHWVACDLNGYNKQFQFLNQDSVNLPNYEIQSKVNAEKYMAAYCSFLQKFFVLYYQEKEDTKHIVMNFPMALVDLNQRTIIANMFFTDLYMKNTKQENENLRGMFAVHFPSSEYFSNVWNSIPLLLHEASHTQNYGVVEDRNKAVIYNIDQFFAELLVEQMLKSVNNGVMFFISSFLAEALREKVYHVLTTCRNKFFERVGGFERWSFKELKENAIEFYSRIFDRYDNRKGITYNQSKRLKERVENDVDYIMQVIGFDAICYPFVEKNDTFPAIGYFVNVLYLESHSGFLKEYRTEYNEKFFNILKKEATEGSEVEQTIKQYALYRFEKYIKQEQSWGEMSNHIEADTSDDLVISLSITLMAGMKAIFEKYRGKFKGEVSEEDYYIKLFEAGSLSNIPSFTGQLEKAYAQFKIQIYNNEMKGSVHDLSLMETMLYEYYELYHCIFNVLRFLMQDMPFGEEDDISSEFVERVYKACREYISEQEEGEHFKAAFSKSNREQLASLGLFEKDSSTMKKIFERVFAENDDTFVKEKIMDRVILFNEVYADCGMCCAMGFDSFGYCMFALSIHNTVNPSDYVRLGADFSADRIRSVIGMYIDPTNEKSKKRMLAEFRQKLCDKEMIVSIGQFLQLVKNCKEIQIILEKCEEDWGILEKSEELEEDLEGNEILKIWMGEIVEKLINAIKENYENDKINNEGDKDKILVAKTYLLCLYNVLQILIDEDILFHLAKDNFDGFFFRLRECMEEGKAIIAVRDDACIKEIRQFYNMDCPKNIQNKFEWYYHIYCGGFASQCNFIFDNYCDYRNAYINLMGKSYAPKEGAANLKVQQWFEELDAYYREEDVK